MTINRRNILSGAVLAALLLLPSVPASAQSTETLDQAMARVTEGLSRQLRKLGAERVLVEVSGPPNDGAIGLMKQKFVNSLEDRAKVEVTRQVPQFKISIDYRRDDRTNKYSMDVAFKDSGNNSLGKFAENFTFDLDPENDARLKGANADVTVAENGEARPATLDNQVQALAEAPNALVELERGAGGGSVVRPQAGSLFGIEVLVETPNGYVPRAAATIDGVPFSEVKLNENYAVRIVNGASHAVAVDLSIDGINMYAMSANGNFRRLGKFIVPAQTSTIIKGWHLGPANDDYAKFNVVQIPDSAATLLGFGESQVGQISAQFFVATKSRESVPATEPIGVADAATGVGTRIKQATIVEPWFLGNSMLAVTTIRYSRPDITDLP